MVISKECVILIKYPFKKEKKMNPQKEKNLFKYINPYTQKKLADNIEIDSVYLHISNLKINSNRKRMLYKVINKSNKKAVIRKLRGKNSIKANEITFDTITANELKLKDGEVLLKPIKWHEKYIIYFWHHPKEDIRTAYKFFLIGLELKSYLLRKLQVIILFLLIPLSLFFLP